MNSLHESVHNEEVVIANGALHLAGDLGIPEGTRSAVIFAHGSGSSRHSPRNREVAAALHHHGIATLLVDLLTHMEQEIDLRTAEKRFDIELLAERLWIATRWLRTRMEGVPIGYFGASTGAAAALVAAHWHPDSVGAIVSRGGRVDLAGEDALGRAQSPTLLIVGSMDHDVLELNRQALERMPCVSRMEIIPGAGHLFEEPGALMQVADLAAEWFTHHLSRSVPGE